MLTTKRQAEILWEIGNWLEPFEYGSDDKPKFIKSTMECELGEVLRSLDTKLDELYDEPSDLAYDKELVKLLSKLYKNIEKEQIKACYGKIAKVQVESKLPF